MTGNMKEVCNRIVDRDEALQMSGRFEPLHDPLSSSDRLMGIFRPIVQAFVGTMLHTRHDLSPCRVIGSKLVGDHYPWRPALAPQQLAHQARCRLGVAATLHQNIENETILIDGAPQPMLFATDRMTTSSRYHLSPNRPDTRPRMSLAKARPNFSAHSRTV